MKKQINIRLPQKLIKSVETYMKKHGYGTIQEFIRETIREKVFDEPTLSKEELFLVEKLFRASKEKKLFGTEEELFAMLKQ